MSLKPRHLALSALVLVSAFLSQAAAQEPTVRLIAMPRDASGPFARSVTGVRALDEALLADWRAAKAEARAAGAQVIVVEITASAGRRHVLAAMAEDFEELRSAGIRIAAWVPEVATGPAALLALEADTLILAADAKIGDANPAAWEGTGDANQAANIREVLARAQAAARRAGHPPLFVEAMIDPELEIYEVRRTGSPPEFVSSRDAGMLPREGISREVVVRKGETLVMNAAQAARFHFPIKTAESRDDVRRALGLEDRKLSSSEIIQLKSKDTGGSWFHVDWTLLLLAGGILFLILELKTPGIGISGVLGIALLAGYFLANASTGGVDAAITIGLLLIGFLLLLVEVVFLPGFGVPGIAGILLILLSIYAASIALPGNTLYEQLVPDSPEDFVRVQAWTINFLGAIVVATLGAFLIAPRLHRLPIFNRAFLAPSLAGPGSPASLEAARSGVSAQGRVHLDVGFRGVSETDLRPAGLARIREHRVDVVTDGEYVARGTPVVITAIEGHRVVVKADKA